MAYRPPTKSAYGDELTLDDKWESPAPSVDTYGYSDSSFKDPQQQLPQPPRPVFGQPANYAPYQSQQPLLNQAQSNLNLNDEYKRLSNSLTQEDIVFMRQWQRDSFYYRVFPITTIGWGLMYLYNKQKDIPHKGVRYVAIGLGSFILGKWLYRDEFKRRLAESKSNTPYMQIFRKHFGLPQLNNAGDFSQTGDQTYGGLDSLDARANDPMSNLPYNRSMTGGIGYKPSGQESGFVSGAHDNLDNSKLEVPKQATSYEELRAKNRGLAR